RRKRLRSVDDQREERSRLIAQVVMLGEIVLADHAEEDRARELILGFDARDRVATDHAVVRAPPVVLIAQRAVYTKMVGGAEGRRERDVVDVGLRPLEEILVLPKHVEHVRVEARPLRRGEREDVISIGNSPDANEWNRVD